MITEPCPEGCGGQIIVGMFDTITVDKLDEEGRVVLGPSGAPEKVQLRLPHHKVRLLGSTGHDPHTDPIPGHAVRDCEGWTEFPEGELGEFDPTGLAPSYCQHGLAEHPDPDIQAAGLRKYGTGISWMRAKYVDVILRGQDPPLTLCIVCKGEPEPSDLTTPRHEPQAEETEAELLAEAFPG